MMNELSDLFLYNNSIWQAVGSVAIVFFGVVVPLVLLGLWIAKRERSE